MSGEADVTARDALAVAQRALSKANAAEDLADDIEDLEDRVVALELRLSERDDSTPYQQLTLDEKVGMVREHAYEKARTAGGHAKLDYDDVMWEVFDGKPSADHCYKLMRIADGGDDERDPLPGFEYRNPPEGNKHLAVDADRAKAHAMFSSANKDPAEGEA